MCTPPGYGRPAGQDGPIATLLLLNGPPGVGKSTLAARLVAGRGDARCVEVDRLRMLIDGWQSDPSTMLTARDLARSACEESLADGLHVVVPQYLGRTAFIAELAAVAASVGARFVEVVLVDDPAAVADRFTARRAELEATGSVHPEADAIDGPSTVAEAITRLDLVVAERPATIPLSLTDLDTDAVLAHLRHLLGG